MFAKCLPSMKSTVIFDVVIILKYLHSQVNGVFLCNWYIAVMVCVMVSVIFFAGNLV